MKGFQEINGFVKKRYLILTALYSLNNWNMQKKFVGQF